MGPTLILTLPDDELLCSQVIHHLRPYAEVTSQPSADHTQTTLHVEVMDAARNATAIVTALAHLKEDAARNGYLDAIRIGSTTIPSMPLEQADERMLHTLLESTDREGRFSIPTNALEMKKQKRTDGQGPIVQWLSDATNWLQLIFLMRYPVIALIVLVCLGPISAFSSARPLLGNLFDLGIWPLFFVALVAFTLMWSCMLTMRTVHLHGGERVGFDSLPKPHQKFRRWWLAIFLLFALPIIGIALLTNREELIGKVFAIVGGGIISFGILTLLWVLQEWLTDPAAVRSVEVIPSLFPNIQKSLQGKDPLRVPVVRRLVRWLDWGARRLGPGYTDQERPPHIYREHEVLLVAFVFVFLVYTVVGSLRLWGITAPALASLLLLVLMLTWFLSGLAFLLDRYRIPVLFVPIVLGTISAWVPWTDYYYHVQQPPLAGPGACQETTNEPLKGSIIVVAANGGGIQSAAWTARVLTGLEKEAQKNFPHESRFSQSVRLISAVSGGSVGAMYVANAYESGTLPSQNDQLDAVAKLAQRSSLDAVAWGLVYPDFVRTILPLPAWWGDRGSALEKAWSNGTSLQSTTLDNWRADVIKGCRPAVIFNTTISDTGRRLLFSTTADSMPTVPDQEEFPTTLDVAVVTATRLSASFPFVTPAARDDIGGTTHVVDGGYYDNYGTSSLVQWLRSQIMDNDHTPIKRVLVIQILGSPNDVTETFPNNQACPLPSKRLSVLQSQTRGWFYQTFAPIQTMLRVRETGQAASSEEQLDALVYQAHTERKSVDIQRVTFQFKGADAPLSWHMTAAQQQNIETSWQSEVSCADHTGVNTVMNWLRTAAP